LDLKTMEKGSGGVDRIMIKCAQVPRRTKKQKTSVNSEKKIRSMMKEGHK
jgi:hypothetical protein